MRMGETGFVSRGPSAGVIARRRAVAVLGLLLAVLGLWLVLGGRLPWQADRHGADVESLSIQSKAVGEELPVKVVIPEGAGNETRPLLVFLHGRDGNEGSELVDEMYAALAEQGDRAPVVAFPYGGESSYWHDRGDGDWAKYVTAEVIPKVESRFDVDAKRVAIGGISMGGFGAFDIAARHPGEFCAVGGHSPAIWQDAGETAAGAFDDAEDFASHDVVAEAAAGDFERTPLWLDAGDRDPFVPGDEAMTAALKGAGANLTRKTFPGEHESAYWDAHWGDYLGFYAKALADCG
jgi:S-formylglutathione hydrolase FrmB